MRNVFSLSAILLLCILINISVFGQATVSGRVTIGSQPAAGVEVMLTSSDPRVLNNNPPPPLNALTDSEGRYRLTNVPAGGYRISAYAPAYVVKTEGIQSSWLGRTLSVSEGEAVEGIDFTLTRGAVITGRVTDSSGRGLIEESISVIPVDGEGKPLNGNQIRSSFVRTDDRGEYRAFGLPAGRYKVVAGSQGGDPRSGILGGGRYVRTWHPETTDESAARIIAIEAGEEAAKIDITMASAEKRTVYSASGKVIEAETGAPVPGVMILFMKVDDQGQPQGAAMNSSFSNSKGEFKIDSLVSNRYMVLAMLFEGERYCDPVFFEISEGDVSGLEVRMERGGSISGTVFVEGGAPPEVMAGLTRIEVAAHSVGNQQRFMPGRGRVSSDAAFRVGGLAPGRVGLRIVSFPLPKGLSHLRTEHNGVEVSGFDLQPGENVTGVRLVLQYGTAVLAGRVEVRNGTLAPGSRLYVSVSRAGMAYATHFGTEVDNRGQFVIEGLGQGEYNVSLNAQVVTADHQFKGFSTSRQIHISGSGRQEITLVLDLSGKEK